MVKCIDWPGHGTLEQRVVVVSGRRRRRRRRRLHVVSVSSAHFENGRYKQPSQRSICLSDKSLALYYPSLNSAAGQVNLAARRSCIVAFWGGYFNLPGLTTLTLLRCLKRKKKQNIQSYETGRIAKKKKKKNCNIKTNNNTVNIPRSRMTNIRTKKRSFSKLFMRFTLGFDTAKGYESQDFFFKSYFFN